jgi:hypothetical protein
MTSVTVIAPQLKGIFLPFAVRAILPLADQLRRTQTKALFQSEQAGLLSRAPVRIRSEKRARVEKCPYGRRSGHFNLSLRVASYMFLWI